MGWRDFKLLGRGWGWGWSEANGAGGCALGQDSRPEVLKNKERGLDGHSIRTGGQAWVPSLGQQ